ncbi:polysaccharide pyruvyl transferase family protein [Photobacterium minamisatsumaniensis]|uniref:polysaccharide pyruvyl transferase family protein n=1 Tax=Photobacterium minamisatsumaniensis TaxID=2910233 RepID=UPI003D143939
MEIDINSYLEKFKGVPFNYIINYGNAGDCLIASGTFQVFDSIGLQYHIKDREKFNYNDKVVIYGGGGNLGHMKNDSARILKKLNKEAKHITILPHTIKDIDELLTTFGSNVDIICRERKSYEYVKQVAVNANVFLCDDMAINLDITSINSKDFTLIDKINISASYLANKLNISKSQVPTKDGIFKMWLINSKIKQLLKSNNKSKTLFAYRKDGEKTNIEIPNDNIDISEELTISSSEKRITQYNSKIFLKFIDNFDVIHTNRLHVCIGAALLNKEVHFHGCNYFKCKAVYEYTLKDKFSNITWYN